MAKGKRKKFITLHRQLQVLIGIGVILAAVVIILMILSRDPLYAKGEEKGPYDASALVADAQGKLGTGKAERVTKTTDTDFKVKLVFEGASSPEVTKQTLNRLGEYKMNAVFCASAIDAVENADTLRLARTRGHLVGSYGMRGESHMETLTTDELLDAFCTSSMVIKQVTGTAPDLVRCYHTNYTDHVLEAAFAADLTQAYDTKYELDVRSFSSFSSVQRYINEKPLGSIVAFRMDGDFDEPAQDQKPEEAKPAVDMKETIERDEDWVDMSLLSDTERALLISEWLIRANAEADYCAETMELREKNSGTLAVEQKTVLTTARGVCFLYSGVTDVNEELTTLLSKLQALSLPATFAVTLDEARAHEEAINAILAAGQDVELAVRPREDSDYYQLCSQILLGRAYLKEHYDCATGDLVVKLGSLESDALKEAASAAGVALLSYQSSIVQDKHRDNIAADKIVSELFGTRVTSLMRGQIVHFAMGHYRDPGMLSRVTEAVYKQKSVYAAMSLESIITDTAERYAYPVPKSAYQSGISDIKPGHITSDQQMMDTIAKRYLGTPSAKYSDNLPGFTADERGRLNKKGFVTTNNRVIFLTVDDWGADDAIDPLLQVLKAHNAKATFFVRSNMVYANPNLLRSIVADGHEVGSHTHTHVPLSSDPDGDMLYSSLTSAECDVLRQDVQESWYALADVIGDMTVNGRPALVKIFRPPTLSVSKEGLATIFDLGFEYIVSGSFSSHDYETESAEALFKDLKPNMAKGAVFVLHMSGNAQYTPEALEMLFAYNESLPANKQYEFPLLGDYLCNGAEVEHPY